MNALVSRIEEAIQAEEATASGPEWRRAHPDTCNWPGDIPGYCDCGSADRVLRRCAAERAIVDEFKRCGPRTQGCPGLRFAIEKMADGYGISTQGEGQ